MGWQLLDLGDRLQVSQSDRLSQQFSHCSEAVNTVMSVFILGKGDRSDSCGTKLVQLCILDTRANLLQTGWLSSSKLSRFQFSGLDCDEQELTRSYLLQSFLKCDDYQ